MRTIYVDSGFKCHVTNDGTMTGIETDFFDDKCDSFVEGYCYEPKANGTVIYPWRPYSELDTAQREYERNLLAEMKESSIAISELKAAYQEGVNSAYG